MKHFYLLPLLFLSACANITPPDTFKRTDIKTDTFTIATWQKITDPKQTFKFYIEGDGHAFDSLGQPTDNPTPHGILVRDMAFNDPSPNVIYLARPCQFTNDSFCTEKYWTSARFSTEVITAEYTAIKTIAPNNPTILIGYSGGAQIAGLIATTKPLNVKKLITVAGNLDHTSWTTKKRLPPLSDSLSLTTYKDHYLRIPQTHYVGKNDTVISPVITTKFTDCEHIVTVRGATHGDGFSSIYPDIWAED